MITASHISVALKYLSAAPSTLGQAYADQPAINELVELGNQLAAGKVLKLYTPDEAAIADKAINDAAVAAKEAATPVPETVA